MTTLYTQDFLAYMALSMSSMPAVFSKGNIDGCTITDNIVLGPYATRSGKRQKVKGKSLENTAVFTSAILEKKHLNQVWDFSTSTDYTTTTDFFYQTAPSVGMGKMIFESVFNTNSTYLAIPFESTNDFPGSISDDYGGTSPSIYWEVSNNYWNHTVATPTIINGSNVQIYFNESTPEFQCTMPAFSIGFGTNSGSIDNQYKKPFGGYILVNDNIIKNDDTKLVIYAGLLKEDIPVEGNTIVYQTVLSMDVVVI